MTHEGWYAIKPNQTIYLNLLLSIQFKHSITHISFNVILLLFVLVLSICVYVCVCVIMI